MKMQVPSAYVVLDDAFYVILDNGARDFALVAKAAGELLKVPEDKVAASAPTTIPASLKVVFLDDEQKQGGEKDIEKSLPKADAHEEPYPGSGVEKARRGVADFFRVSNTPVAKKAEKREEGPSPSDYTGLFGKRRP